MQLNIRRYWPTASSTAGTGIKTKSGDEVLAIDADNGILILELRIHDTRTDTYSRGVLAIGKDPSRLHLYPATTLPAYGQRAGVIAKNNGGVLAMTGSGFIDEGGVGNGGEIAGFARCDGKDYGTHMKWGSKRLELHENNWFYLKDAPTETSSDTTDCMEFQPAMVINGQAQDIGYWYDVNPRACIGQSSKGEILMLVVEGRGVGGSPGVSLKECVKVLMDHNCQTAMNCDGGTPPSSGIGASPSSAAPTPGPPRAVTCPTPGSTWENKIHLKNLRFPGGFFAAADRADRFHEPFAFTNRGFAI